MGRLEKSIVKFFEKHNGKFQIIVFVIVSGLSVLANISQDKQLAIIVGLLFLITLELISFSFKDCLSQNKLDNIGTNMENIGTKLENIGIKLENIIVKLEIDSGGLFRVHDFDLTKFFNSTKTNFFISGIALNGFIEKNTEIIEKFLNEGKEVYILMADPNAVGETTKLYHGEKFDEKAFIEKTKVIYNKQITTLYSLKDIKNVFSFLESGKLKLRVTQAVMSTSFVAYDIFDNDSNEGRKELKASFYQYRCTIPEDEPNIIVDSIYNKNWYLFFKETIKKQWNDARPIQGKNDFEKLEKETLHKFNGDTKKKVKN